MNETREISLSGRLFAITARYSAATLGKAGEVGVDVGVALARALAQAGISEFDGECEIVVRLLPTAGEVAA